MEDALILVVDDEEKILESVQSFLESKGYKVITAENGKKTFEQFKTYGQEIDLILLDLMLPDMDGTEIAMEIRKSSRVPIIMLTARVEENDMLKGFSMGADDYITKPFSLKALVARIEAVLRRTAGEKEILSSIMSFAKGDLVINFDSHEVKKAGEIVHLTAAEYNILSVLAQNINKVFTREELILQAFSDDFDGYDRIVDSHIKNIRSKIEEKKGKPKYIETVFGVGYKFGEI